MREGGYDPKGGNPVPIELIYESNIISHEEYEAEIDRQRRVKQSKQNEKAIEEIELEAQVLNDRAIRAGVPKRYLEYAIDLTRIEDLQNGRGIYFFGKQGSHKTTTACSMLRGWLRDNTFGLAKFVRATTLIDDFNDTYSTRETIAQVMNQYANVGLLLIDDLGKEVPTARAVSRLWELIDRRYGEQLPTIITSQFRPDALAKQLGDGGGVEASLAIYPCIRYSSFVMPEAGTRTCVPASIGLLPHVQQRVGLL